MAHEIDLTDPQTEMLLATDANLLFVAGYGSGKTQSMLCNALDDALGGSGRRVAAYCPTYDLLRLNFNPRLEEILGSSGIPYDFNKSEGVFYLPNESQIILRSLNNPERIIAYEVFSSHVDEIDTITKAKCEDLWRKIKARNRQKIIDEDGKPIQNRVRVYTTPDGGLASFTYSVWGKDQIDGYRYIRASSHSNPHLPPDYVKELYRIYPAEYVEAYVNGLWVNLATGTVFKSYDRVRCRTDAEYKSGEVIRVGMDFNVTKMSAVIYVVRGNVWHSVDEITKAFDTPDIIRIIKERYPNAPEIIVYPDATGGSRDSNNASVTDITLLRNAKFIVRAKPSNPPVKDRILASNSAFNLGLVKVNDKKCPKYAESLESLPYTDDGEPDKSTGYDHVTDAGTYPIAYEMPIRRPASSGKTVGHY